MAGGLRVKYITFAFPFYERQGFTEKDCEKRAIIVNKLFRKIPFVTDVRVDLKKLRDPLYISINPHHHKIQDRNVEDIEAALEKLLEKVYNFRQCL